MNFLFTMLQLFLDKASCFFPYYRKDKFKKFILNITNVLQCKNIHPLCTMLVVPKNFRGAHIGLIKYF